MAHKGFIRSKRCEHTCPIEQCYKFIFTKVILFDIRVTRNLNPVFDTNK